jgi:hypothetical protein
VATMSPDSPAPAEPPPARPVRRPDTGVLAVAGLLLIAPFVALLWVSSYAKDSPRLLGFPFFYWYQFLWVIVSAGLTWVAYLIVRRAERRR